MDLKNFRTVKRHTFGPILLEMLKNGTEDYVVMYTRGTTILEIYEHPNFDAAEQDWNTLYCGFRNMINAIKLSLGDY